MTTTYKYIDIDGDEIIGTLQEIGDKLINWHGALRLTDNQEPWLDIDDWGNWVDREFTVEEWVNWASKFEDRPVRHVRLNLKQLKKGSDDMTFKTFYLYGLEFVATPKGMAIRNEGESRQISLWYWPEDGLNSQEEYEQFARECYRELSPRL